MRTPRIADANYPQTRGFGLKRETAVESGLPRYAAQGSAHSFAVASKAAQKPENERGADFDDRIESVYDGGAVEEGRVDADKRLCPRFTGSLLGRGDPLVQQRQGYGVNDSLLLGEGLRVGKDDARDLLSVDAAAREYYGVSEARNDRFFRLGRFDGLPAEEIGVDAGPAPRLEESGDGVLPGAVAAGQPDQHENPLPVSSVHLAPAPGGLHVRPQGEGKLDGGFHLALDQGRHISGLALGSFDDKLVVDL